MPDAPFPLLGSLLGAPLDQAAWKVYLDQQRQLVYDTIGPDWPLFNRHVEHYNNRVWDALHKAVVTHQHQWVFSDPSRGELDITTAFRHHVAHTLDRLDSFSDSIRCRLTDRRDCQKATRDMEKEFMEMPTTIHSRQKGLVHIPTHIQALFSPKIKRMFAPVYAIVPPGTTFFPVDTLKAAWSEGRDGAYEMPTSVSSPSTPFPVLKSTPGIMCWCGCEGPAWCEYATALIEYNNRVFEQEEEDARAEARANEEADASRKRGRSPDPVDEDFEVDVPSFNNFHLEDKDDEMPSGWESSTDTPHPVIDWEAVMFGPQMKRPRLLEAAGMDVLDDIDILRCADPDAFCSIPDDGVGA